MSVHLDCEETCCANGAEKAAHTFGCVGGEKPGQDALHPQDAMLQPAQLLELCHIRGGVLEACDYDVAGHAGQHCEEQGGKRSKNHQQSNVFEGRALA